MIYTVGFEHSSFKSSTLNDAIDYLERCPLVGLDIETTRKFKGIYGKMEGLDPYTSNIVMIQIGDLNRQYILDARKIPKKDVTNLFERLNIRKIKYLGHNIKFEFKHIYHNYRVELGSLLDTMLMEVIINNGLNPIRDLKGLIKKYLKKEVDKDIRMTFLSIGENDFTFDQILYGADDIILPLQFYERQLKQIDANGSMNCLKLESEFTKPLAMMEYNGFTIDVDKWKILANKNTRRLEEQKYILEDLIVEALPPDSIYINRQLDLFDVGSSKLSIELGSKLTVKMFQELGVNCEIVDKNTKKLKPTLEAKALKVYLTINEKVLDPDVVTVMREYIKYKNIEKTCTTYGTDFIDKYVNPITGKLHSNFNQLVETGRIASSNPNVQNIPNTLEFRECFVASEGNTLVNADYSGQENIILVNQSMDPDLLSFYRNDEDDMHSFIASKLFPVLNGLTLSEIKEKFPDLRQTAKSAGFAIKPLRYRTFRRLIWKLIRVNWKNCKDLKGNLQPSLQSV